MMMLMMVLMMVLMMSMIDAEPSDARTKLAIPSRGRFETQDDRMMLTAQRRVKLSWKHFAR